MSWKVSLVTVSPFHGWGNWGGQRRGACPRSQLASNWSRNSDCGSPGKPHQRGDIWAVPWKMNAKNWDKNVFFYRDSSIPTSLLLECMAFGTSWWVKQESRGAGQENWPLILPNEEEVPSLLPTTQGSLFRLRSRPHRWFSSGSEMERAMAAEWGSMWVEMQPCQPLEPRVSGQPWVGVERVLQRLGT